MQHPFGGILRESEDSSPDQQQPDGQSRREVLRSALQVSAGAVAAGAVAAGAVGDAHAQYPPRLPVTSQAIGEEGGRRPGDASTKAGPSHPEHAGQKVRNAMADLATAQLLLRQKKWDEAAAKLTQVRKVAAPMPDKYSHHARLQQRREALEKQFNKLIKKALDTADRQAKAGKLVPALQTFRQADRLDEHYGVKQRAQTAIASLARQEGYEDALKRVKALESRPQPSTAARLEEGGDPTTFALGEEGGASTKARGEEGGGRVTTQAIGEEGGKRPGGASTRARGEEGGGRVTTQAIGEEGGRRPGGARPKAGGEGRGGGVTSQAIGEEG